MTGICKENIISGGVESPLHQTTKKHEGVKNMKKHSNILASCFLVAGLSASAVDIQLDFGNQGEYSGINSPSQSVGELSTGDSHWNSYTRFTANNQSVAVAADGTLLSGVTIDFGDDYRDSGLINWSDNWPGTGGTTPTDSDLNTTALTSDWMYVNPGRMGGVRIQGLETGTYYVYAFGHEPSNLKRTMNVSTGVNASTLAQCDETNFLGNASGLTEWTAGKNYVMNTITITDTSDWLTVLISDPDSGTQHKSLNGLQIVSATAVPEPATVGLFALCGGLLLFKRRR